MEASRNFYLEKLKSHMWDGQIKIITGIRRCGKSYLLKTIFRRYLEEELQVPKRNILTLELDSPECLKLRNPLALHEHVKKWHGEVEGKRYLFVDEIQMCQEVRNPYVEDGEKIRFYDVLNGFLHMKDLDCYVTGSNSKMLSSDVRTEFRGRGHEIRLHPLSFAEYLEVSGLGVRDSLDAYMRFGGMPYCLGLDGETEKEEYLKGLFEELYLRDIVERYGVRHDSVLGLVTDYLCSAVGSLSNVELVGRSLKMSHGIKVAHGTLERYLDCLKDSFLFSEARRYDVRGRRYFEYPSKFYCEDLGLRNARLNYRQFERTHLMENAIYNELVRRGYSCDVGVVYVQEKKASGGYSCVPAEIDFVCNRASERIYIQSAFAMEDVRKKRLEKRPLMLTGDAFRKVVVRDDIAGTFYDDDGVLNMLFCDFLLKPELL